MTEKAKPRNYELNDEELLKEDVQRAIKNAPYIDSIDSDAYIPTGLYELSQ